MSVGERGRAQVTLGRGRTRSRAVVNKARQRRRVPPQLLEKDFVARLCGPQQGATVILSALSSARVFLLPQPVT